jgi:hypothetical protein
MCCTRVVVSFGRITLYIVYLYYHILYMHAYYYLYNIITIFELLVKP